MIKKANLRKTEKIIDLQSPTSDDESWYSDFIDKNAYLMDEFLVHNDWKFEADDIPKLLQLMENSHDNFMPVIENDFTENENCTLEAIAVHLNRILANEDIRKYFILVMSISLWEYNKSCEEFEHAFFEFVDFLKEKKAAASIDHTKAISDVRSIKADVFLGNDYLKEFEATLAEDEVCIFFDFSVYFPAIYALTKEDVQFSFNLGETETKDLVVDNRFPNKRVYTISKKEGRKANKYGYPCIFKIEKDKRTVLSIVTVKFAGASGQEAKIIFPLQVDFTDNKRLAVVMLRINTAVPEHTFLAFMNKEGESQQYWDLNMLNFEVASDVDAALFKKEFKPIAFGFKE